MNNCLDSRDIAVLALVISIKTIRNTATYPPKLNLALNIQYGV